MPVTNCKATHTNKRHTNALYRLLRIKVL